MEPLFLYQQYRENIYLRFPFNRQALWISPSSYLWNHVQTGVISQLRHANPLCGTVSDQLQCFLRYGYRKQWGDRNGLTQRNGKQLGGL